MATFRDELNQANPNRLAIMLTKLKFGEVLNMLLADSAESAGTVGSALSAVATADANTQGGTYNQTDVQSIATLANALKASLNTAIALINQLRTAALATSRPTESGVTVTSNVATLANTPSALQVANATAGGTTGMKKLLNGQITGANAVVPKTGEAVWDGGVKVLFASTDGVTTADFFYTRAADVTVSALQALVEVP